MDITYTFFLCEASNFTVTNTKESALRLIESWYTLCLIPQMFESDNGIYGAYLDDDCKKVSREDAVAELQKIERDFISAHNKQDKPVFQMGGQSMIPERKFDAVLENEIVPKILSIMEESGMSANQAIRVAPVLARIVGDTNCELNSIVRFRANPKEWAEGLP